MDALQGSSLRGEIFGRTAQGAPVRRYTLERGGVLARVMEYGATLTELSAPDRRGRVASIVLGSETLEPYLAGFPAAATIGRVANRIANARFTLDGREVVLEANEGHHHLHGGRRGFDKALWRTELAARTGEHDCVCMRLVSRDGDGGYPGNLSVTVTYALDDRGSLGVHYHATTDRATPVNFTNHAYFNLTGEGTVLDHELWVDADAYTPTDAELIPTGAIAPVADTPLDFRRPRRLRDRIATLEDGPAGGYDHNLVLRRGAGVRARLSDPASGRVLEIATGEPGLQLYTANRLAPVTSTGGVRFRRHGAVCLETQHFPDAVHHPEFPSVILRPGAVFESVTVYTIRSGADRG